MNDKRSIRLSLVGGLALIISNTSVAETTIQSSFERGLDGWTSIGLGIDTSVAALSSGNLFSLEVNNDMVHDSGGDIDPDVIGKPGGFARLNDVTGGSRAFARAPGKFTGDLSLFHDTGSIQFQHRLFTPLPFAQRDNAAPFTIIIVSGDINDLNAYAAGSPSDAPGHTRGSFVTITEFIGSGFEFEDYATVGMGLQDFAFDPITDLDLGHLDPDLEGSTIAGVSGGALQTSMTLEQVLANVTDIFITFERVDNSPLFSEVSGIDNVILRTPKTRPRITSIISVGSLFYELSLAGDPNTGFTFHSSTTLDFSPGNLITNLTQELGAPGVISGVDASIVTTDSAGTATVRMSLGGPDRNFVRAQTQP